MDMRRSELFAQRKFGAWLFFLLLALLTGHGERLGRIVIAWISLNVLFSTIYWGISVIVPGASPLPYLTAVVLSITSFLGRGYLPPSITLDNLSVGVSVVEAIIGFVIEVTFIAAFSRRFLGD
jgi:hypothetical protein